MQRLCVQTISFRLTTSFLLGVREIDRCQAEKAYVTSPTIKSSGATFLMGFSGQKRGNASLHFSLLETGAPLEFSLTEETVHEKPVHGVQ